MKGVSRALLALSAAAMAVGCGSSGSDGPSLSFDYTMSPDALRSVAESAGVELSPGATKSDMLAALGEALGCVCDEALVCGVDTCGQACGTCTDAQVCFEGACADKDAGSYYGFTPFSHSVSARRLAGITKVRYSAVDGLDVPTEPPFARLSVEIVQERFTGGPGTYDLTNAGAADCDICVRANHTCNEISCFNDFIPESGKIHILDPGEPGGRLAAYLEDVTFIEYRNLGPDGTPIPWDNGKRWYMPFYLVDEPVPQVAEAANDCVAEGTGRELYTNIADFTLTNCNGQEVNLHSRCGQASAVWAVLTAGW